MDDYLAACDEGYCERLLNPRIAKSIIIGIGKDEKDEGSYSGRRAWDKDIGRVSPQAKANDRDWRKAYSLAHNENLLTLWPE